MAPDLKGGGGKQGGAESVIERRRILIVDDHPVVREGLIQSINREDDLVVCAEAGDAQEALAAVGKLAPDLVVVDISLPDRGGLELIKDIVATEPGIAVLGFSMHDEAVFGERVLRAGGRGYVSKDEDASTMLVAIRRVLDGGIYVSEKLLSLVLGGLSGTEKGESSSSMDLLTDRELEVFSLIGRALGTTEIAHSLNMSVKTVEAHRANIKLKLGLRSGLELVRRAVLWVESAR
ncbi:MAG TPA: response regulator transcription factor [Verrucomicrobiae bacterium]|nr:response regulator transcription factor [Verrucomicrobiae bacterium]